MAEQQYQRLVHNSLEGGPTFRAAFREVDNEAASQRVLPNLAGGLYCSIDAYRDLWTGKTISGWYWAKLDSD